MFIIKHWANYLDCYHPRLNQFASETQYNNAKTVPTA